MPSGSVPPYLGSDEAVKRWSESLARFLNAAFLDLYKITDRAHTVKYLTITASGTIPIGGIGYTPSCIHVLAEDSSIDSFSFGIDDGANHHCLYSFLNGSNVSQAEQSSLYSGYLKNNAASNVLSLYVSSKNSDGFTLTATVTGTISASVKLLVMP